MSKLLNKEDSIKFLKSLTELREIYLNQNDTIKKYRKWRKVHADILYSMEKYFDNFGSKLDKIEDDLLSEVEGNELILFIDLDLRKRLDKLLFVNLQVYKSHPKMTSITEEFISKNKFRIKDKVKLLNAMNNSFISFFRIDDKNPGGYILVTDLVTLKKYKIIDIALSHPLSKSDLYIYSRLITVDGISFFSTLFGFPTDNIIINKYIDSLKNKKKSTIIKTLETYDLYKKYGLNFTVNEI